MKRTFLIILFIFVYLSINAQNDDYIDLLQQDIFFQDEFTVGVKVSTNGWGMDFRRGYAINPKRKKMYEFGFNTIKHPKEYKFSSYYFISKKFVYGKLNYCMDFKIGYGQQVVLYDKREAGTVQIRMFAYGGIDLAILKPIYYKVIINNHGDTEYQKYQPAHQPALIERAAPFSKGLLETKINPGLYFKIGTSFEHSKNVKSIRSLELGIEGYVFSTPLEILAEVNNPQFVVSLFISYRLGTILKPNNSSN